MTGQTSIASGADTANAGRVPDLRPEELSPLQQQLRQDIAGPRGGVVRGPFALWLRIPALADRANQLGNALRLEGKLDKRVFEVVILVVARHWSAQYEWFAHAQAAESVGISATVIEAIRQRAAPASPQADEQLAWALTLELNEKKHLSQASHAKGQAMFGVEGMIELVTVAGFYTMVAMMINAFDAPVPGGARPLD